MSLANLASTGRSGQPTGGEGGGSLAALASTPRNIATEPAPRGNAPSQAASRPSSSGGNFNVGSIFSSVGNFLGGAVQGVGNIFSNSTGTNYVSVPQNTKLNAPTPPSNNASSLNIQPKAPNFQTSPNLPKMTLTPPKAGSIENGSYVAPSQQSSGLFDIPALGGLLRLSTQAVADFPTAVGKIIGTALANKDMQAAQDAAIRYQGDLIKQARQAAAKGNNPKARTLLSKAAGIDTNPFREQLASLPNQQDVLASAVSAASAAAGGLSTGAKSFALNAGGKSVYQGLSEAGTQLGTGGVKNVGKNLTNVAKTTAKTAPLTGAQGAGFTYGQNPNATPSELVAGAAQAIGFSALVPLALGGIGLAKGTRVYSPQDLKLIVDRAGLANTELGTHLTALADLADQSGKHVSLNTTKLQSNIVSKVMGDTKVAITPEAVGAKLVDAPKVKPPTTTSATEAKIGAGAPAKEAPAAITATETKAKPLTQVSIPGTKAPTVKLQSAFPATGVTKVSKLATGVEKKAVEAKLTERLSNLPEYATMNVKNQASLASDLLVKDEGRANRIALGHEESPSHIKPEAVFTAVENKALKEGNIEMINQLAHSPRVGEATQMGQRIRLLAERNPESPVSTIAGLSSAKTAAVEKTLNGGSVASASKNIVEGIKSHLKPLAAEDLKGFIEGLRC